MDIKIHIIHTGIIPSCVNEPRCGNVTPPYISHIYNSHNPTDSL